MTQDDVNAGRGESGDSSRLQCGSPCESALNGRTSTPRLRLVTLNGTGRKLTLPPPLSPHPSPSLRRSDSDIEQSEQPLAARSSSSAQRSSSELPQSASPDDSQATSHLCIASSSPVPARESEAAAASQEQSEATRPASCPPAPLSHPPSSSSLAQPPPPSPRIVASSPSAALLPAAAAAVEPELLASPPVTPACSPASPPSPSPSRCLSQRRDEPDSVSAPSSPIPPSSVSLCSSPVLQLSTRPDDSQATSHLCEASSSPASEQESVAAASSQE